MSNNTKNKLDQLKDLLDADTPTNDYLNTPLQVVDNNELTQKQLAFIDEYMIDLNGAAAAKRVGYSEKTAVVQASRLLTNVNIKVEIQRRQHIEMVKNGVKREHIIQAILDTILQCDIRLGEAFETTDFVSLTNTKLKAIDMLNKMGGYYVQFVVNTQQEIPLFPDVKPDSNIEDVTYE